MTKIAAIQSLPSVTEIIDAVGRDVICAHFECTPENVRNVKFRNSFPASWYVGMVSLCAAANIACPLELFRWKMPAGGIDALAV